jgi:ribosomal protein L11 methyltransferase
VGGDRQIVQLDVSPEEAELAADALWQARPSAVSELALADGRVRLVADVADLEALDERWPVVVLDVDGEEHLDAWRAWAVPMRAGRRILLQPAWLPLVDAGPADVVVSIDPGRSFGSGSHPSTRLVLALLEDLIDGGERVLDVGCGSGVLAIAACRLGAASAAAVDVDPAAIDATAANAAANGVADRVVAVQGDAAATAGSFDVVVANIGLRVLQAEAPAIVERVRVGGLLVLAGLLVEQADTVAAAFGGCRERERRVDGEWVALVLRRDR